MRKQLIVTTLAASLALTGIGTAPANASGNDLAKILAGVATVAIIGKVINDRNNRKAARAAAAPVYVAPNAYGTLRPFDRSRDRWVLPDRCARRFETRNGSRNVYLKRCLEKNLYRANRLPDRCERVIRTDRGNRRVYGARCLRREGWQVAAFTGKGHLRSRRDY